MGFSPFAEILSRCGEIRSDRLPRAKLCCFSANHDSTTSTTRRSDGPKRYELAGMNFNTFARWIFLRLPRSCRVAEKSDPIDRFSGPDLQKITKNQWFLSNFSTTRHDRAKRRKTHLANVSKGRLPNYAGNANTQVSQALYFLGSCAIFIHSSAPMAPLRYLAAMAGGAPPPPHPPQLISHFYCFDICSREPNRAVFQQITTVVHSQRRRHACHLRGDADSDDVSGFCRFQDACT